MRVFCPALAALLVFAAGSAQAGGGVRGANLGSPGEVTTTFGTNSDDVAQALVLQPDGKIVVGGYRSGDDHFDFALVRYDADGALDRSFGTGGRVITSFGSATANAIALQPDGKIVAAGALLVANPDFDIALGRYEANGTLDPSFGNAGKVTTTFGSTSDVAQAVALEPGGKIVVAGASGFPQQRDEAFALARYDADGALDQSFGTGGKVTTRFSSPGDDSAHALLLQPDGKVVAVGSDFVAARAGSSDFALARYDVDGKLDRSFGTGGKVTTTFDSGSDFGNAAVLQPDGKIVVAGYTYVGGVAGRSYFALARYDVDGTLDRGFGADGKVTTDLGPGGAAAWAVTLQPDGKIVAAGNGQSGSFALARYAPDGKLDTTFGSGGTVTSPVGLVDEGAANAVALRGDGSMVAAGWSITCTYQDFTLARYTLNGSLDARFGSTDARCIVPNVKGRRLAAARSAIKRRDCTVGPIGTSFSRKVKKGYVIGQYPGAGTRCLPGMKVTLSVSKGKRKRR
jgi:uncharacterized delta-60 repeat protein